MINPDCANTNLQTNNNIGNKIEDFIKIKCLADSLSKVYQMKSKLDNQIYAVKLVKMAMKDNMEKINIQREKIIMENISHPNIAKLYTTFYDNDYFYFVYEFIDGTNLENFVKDYQKNNPNSHIPQKLVISIFKQILLGYNYLYGKGILHRDIKPDSIMIDKNNNVKIISFGLSALFQQNCGVLSYNGSFVGRIDVVCPEILNSQKYDFKCDIFSIGYTMFFVMNYCFPTKIIIDQAINETKRIPSNPTKNEYDKKLVQLVDSMYRENPMERPDTSQALKELEIIEKNINNP